MNSVYLFIKLSLLAFYPTDTKIAINENAGTVSIHPPGWTQGVWRWAFGNSRDEIILIKTHIQNMMFLLSNSYFKSGDALIYCMRKALSKLKTCYIDVKEIKNLLQLLEEDLTLFFNSKGKDLQLIGLSVTHINSNSSNSSNSNSNSNSNANSSAGNSQSKETNTDNAKYIIACNNKKREQIMNQWTYKDIRFINYNFKCMLELDKVEKTETGFSLQDKYIQIINEYIDNIHNKPILNS